MNDMRWFHQVAFDLADERARQDEKWGDDRDLPDFDPRIGAMPKARFYDLPSEREAQDLCENASRTGNGNWGVIVVEEVAEAFNTDNVEDLRTELVQVAASVVAWIEAIDRRNS